MKRKFIVCLGFFSFLFSIACQAQKPKVIFSKNYAFHCSSKDYDSSKLRKLMGGYIRVDSAFNFIKIYFNEETDHFALICPTCSSDALPLFMRFPEDSKSTTKTGAKAFGITEAKPRALTTEKEVPVTAMKEKENNEVYAKMSYNFSKKSEEKLEAILFIDTVAKLPISYFSEIDFQYFADKSKKNPTDSVFYYAYGPTSTWKRVYIINDSIRVSKSFFQKEPDNPQSNNAAKFSLVAMSKTGYREQDSKYILFMTEEQRREYAQLQSVLKKEVPADDYDSVLEEFLKEKYNVDLIPELYDIKVKRKKLFK